jgi:predicted lipase
LFFFVHLQPDYRFLITGYSMGGALASLTAYRLAKEKGVSGARIALYTFGQPRVGGYAYAREHDRLVPHTYEL